MGEPRRPQTMTKPVIQTGLVTLLTMALTWGCSTGDAPVPQLSSATNAPTPKTTAKPMTQETARTQASTLFANRCATCHGVQGQGDGLAAAKFPVKPRSFADAKWQNTVTDDHLRKVILQGGQAVGKSMLMPPNPDLKTKPMVMKALVEMIRSFGLEAKAKPKSP